MSLLIIFGLIILNAFFSMAEIALVSSRKARLESQAAKGDLAARRALDLTEQPARLISTVQIGLTLIGILIGNLSGRHMEAGAFRMASSISLDWRLQRRRSHGQPRPGH